MNPGLFAATALISLMKLRGIGRRGAIRIYNEMPKTDDPMALRRALSAAATQPKFSEFELTEAWSKGEKQIESSIDAGVQIFAIADQAYPARLRTIPDPPPVLFIKGSMSALDASKAVAIVGTREPTSYGETVARRSGKTAAQAGWCVVSGLAHGCDTFGHQGCLEGQGTAIAVLAHGLDKVYPAANRGLAAEILDNKGCLVSEYPVGVAPIRSAFAERDRIQSGLSDAVLVIETDVTGGTMHTVRFAREQKRPLACICHPEKWRSADKTRGNQKMIEDGWAKPISDGGSLATFLDQVAIEITQRTPPVDISSAELKSSSDPAQRAWAF